MVLTKNTQSKRGRLADAIKHFIEGDFIDLRSINFNVEHYKPKKNKAKVSILAFIVVVCVVTPCTNWILYPIKKGLEHKPIWLYTKTPTIKLNIFERGSINNG